MTTTTNKLFVEPVTGSTPGGVGGWGDILNTINTQIDSCFGNTSTITLSSSTYTLSSTDIRSMRLYVIGSISADTTISIPSGVQGAWIITNYATSTNTSSPFYVYINTTAVGSYSFYLPRASTITIYCDGTNIWPTANNVPAGQIITFAGSTPPSSYVACDGAAYSRVSASALFKAIGTTWGAGDGVTTFNVPNLQGYFLRGSGTSAIDPDSPRSVGTSQTDAFKSHTHTDSGHTHTYDKPNSDSQALGGSGSNYLRTSVSSVATGTGQANIQATGGVETRPTNVAVLYCIKS